MSLLIVPVIPTIPDILPAGALVDGYCRISLRPLGTDLRLSTYRTVGVRPTRS